MHRGKLVWSDICKPKDTKECWQLPETKRCKERSPSGAVRESKALTAPWSGASSLQNWETIHFCYLKPPSLWDLVRAALEDWYNCLLLVMSSCVSKMDVTDTGFMITSRGISGSSLSRCPSFCFYFYSYVHTMFGSFLPPSPPPPPLCPHPIPLPPTPSLPGRNYFVLISNFVDERV
jgi:hypothetical protein